MDTFNNEYKGIEKKNNFKVPEGYFDKITEEVMSRLPERVAEESITLSLWDRVKPWVYMAAMFAGIALIVKIFVGTPTEKNNTAALFEIKIPVAEIDEFYTFYEEQAVNGTYQETVYSEDQEDQLDNVSVYKPEN